MDREKRNEQWSDLCRGTRKVAEDLGQAAWAGVWRAGHVAEGAARSARLGLRVLELQTAFRAQLRRVGELVYATHSGNPTDSATLQAALERADALREELEVCRRSLAELRGVVACDMCGAENSAGSGRCARCGQPLRR